MTTQTAADQILKLHSELKRLYVESINKAEGLPVDSEQWRLEHQRAQILWEVQLLNLTL